MQTQQQLQQLLQLQQMQMQEMQMQQQQMQQQMMLQYRDTLRVRDTPDYSTDRRICLTSSFSYWTALCF